jgi:ABC-type amino acid transport substrate-binding protein
MPRQIEWKGEPMMRCIRKRLTTALPAGLCTIAALALAAVADGAAAQMPKFPANSYMATIQQRGKIWVGVKSDLRGVGYLNPMTGKYEGFGVDLARDLARRILGAPGGVVFKPALPRTRVPMLTEGLIDVDVETMFITPARVKVIDFSDPYWGSPTLIMVRKDNNSIKDKADLAGKTVAASKGSSTERDFREHRYGYPNVKLLLFDSPAEATEAVNVGRADATVFDEALGLSIMMVAPYYKFVGKPIKYSYYGIGIKKGRPEFVKFVNDWLSSIKKSGRWAELYKKNLPGAVPEPPMPPYDKAYHGG